MAIPAKKTFLLVNPYIHDFAAYNLWLKPLGLMKLYTFLKQCGFPVFYIDPLFPTFDEQNKYPITSPESKKYHTGKFNEELILKPLPYRNIPRNYRCFGIPKNVFLNRLQSIPKPNGIFMTSGMTYWYPGVQQTIKLLKKVFPDVPVILGGIYATLCLEHAAHQSGADRVIAGNWQDKIPTILMKLFDVHGLKMSLTNEYFPTEDASLYPDSKFAVLRLSEGCPFQCTYCASNLLSNKFHRFSKVDVFEEILHYVLSGREDIAFYDDALFVNAKASLIPLLERIRNENISCRFHTPNGLHARYVTEELAELLYSCNFKTLRLSFDRVSGDTNSKVGSQHLENAVGALQKAGYPTEEIEVYTLIGTLGQKLDSIYDTIKFIRRLGVKVKVAQYSPTPKTKMFEQDCRYRPGLRSEPLLQNSTVAAVWDFNTERYDKIKIFARSGVNYGKN